ncbi:MinD/ParA family protein [uncultured Microbacterium sp.]|uniref:nucleotide-binding protein n=1 Tax=uncultured Microbacterium sp. TaxID=191216 RepID=UPI0025D372AC|nr:MinD/ParA family protein [uncultured Microbacterium sp.]
MTPDRTDANPDESAEHGVLDESGNLDTASITILGGHIAQVNVDLPVASDDDTDDDVIEDEIRIDDVDLPALDDPSADDAEADDVPEPHVETLPTGDIILEPHDETHAGADDAHEVHDAELVDDAPAQPDDLEVVDDVELFEADAAEPVDLEPAADNFPADDAPIDDASDDAASNEHDAAPDAEEPPAEQSSAGESIAEELSVDEPRAEEPGAAKGSDQPDDAPSLDEAAPDVAAEPVDALAEEPLTHAPWTPAAPEAESALPAPDDESATDDAPAPQDASTSHDAPATQEAPAADAAASRDETAASVATRDEPTAPTTRAERAATGAIGTIPLTRRSAHQADEAARVAEQAARVDRAHAMERVQTPTAEVAYTSKRIGQIDDTRESSDLLTADRLLDPRQIARPEPEGMWQQLVYSVSRHRINLGDGRRARERKDLDRRIAAPLSGGARFVPVLSRKGGVGKTTVTSLLGMALADARDDRIIAVDANPDRGTLADRVGRANGRTVRDLVRAHDEMAGYNDVSSIVARDETRLDVLASDADPRVSEAFSDDDYRQVADVAAHYYSIVLTDTGTGIVHSVMGATLEMADTLVIVAGLSVDEARLASETLTWLETNGYAARVRDAVVVLNASRPGAPLVRESELEAHFRSRVRTVIRMPYDPRIAAGSAIAFRDLQPATRQAARELAAAVVEGLRAPVAAA